MKRNGRRPVNEILTMDVFCPCWRGIVNARGLKPAGKRLPGGFSKPHGRGLNALTLGIRVPKS